MTDYPYTELYWENGVHVKRVDGKEVQMTQDTRPDGPTEAVGENGLVRMQETGPPTVHPGGYRSPPALSTVEAVAEALLDAAGEYGPRDDGNRTPMMARGWAHALAVLVLTALRARGYDVVKK